MSHIKFLDIYNQDKKIFKKILANISRAIKNNKFILTKEVSEFEKKFAKYCNTKYAIGVANGTDALYLALKSLNLKENSEVIIPAMTWKSTVTSVLNNNLAPILVDINKNNSNIDLNDLSKKINRKTRVIIVVHLYGNPGEIHEIKKIIKGKNIKIIEDAAQAHGAIESETKKKVGSIGDLGCFSFYPGKNLGAYGDAGCITTNSKKYYKKILSLRNIGIFNNKNKSDCNILGINSRLDTLQAVVLNEKLKKLDLLNKKRKNIAEIYNLKINNSKIKKLDYKNGSVYHQYVIKTKNRLKFLYHLKKNKIEYGTHYSISINNLRLLKKYFKNKKFPNSEILAKQCVSLPINPNLKKNEIKRIINAVNTFD
mgnify:FL=1